MSTNAIVFDHNPPFGADAWKCLSDITTQAVAEAKGLIQGRSRVLPLPMRLWSYERELRPLVQFLHNPSVGLKGRRPAPSASTAPVDPLSVIRQMINLSIQIEDLYADAKKRGLTNRTLTAAALNSIQSHGISILDVAEAWEVALSPRTEEMFEEAHRQYLAGETVDMGEIF